jgi:hypothetical protein
MPSAITKHKRVGKIVKFFASILQPNWQDKLTKDAIKKAPNEGKLGKPSPDAINFDKHETNIKNTVENLVLKARNVVFEQTRKLDKNISKYEGDLEIVRTETDNRQSDEALYQDAFTAQEERREKFVDLLTKRIACEGNLNAFRVTNKIDHEPDHPSDQMHFLSIVFLIFAAECLFNAMFWKGEDGLIGGIVTAMIFATVNILFALAMGILFRYKNLTNSRYQFLGWSGLVLAIAVGALIAAWVATQRSYKEIEKFITPDLGAAFSSVPSALFLFGTVIAAAVAFYKGYYVFGTVPGYKRVSEDFSAADAAASEFREGTKKVVAAIYDQAIELRTKSLRQLKDLQKDSFSIQADLKAVRTEYANTTSQIQNGYRTIMKAYRETNLASRPSNIPGPVYWTEPLEIEVIEPPDLQLSMTRIEDLISRIADLNVELGEVLQEEKTSLITKKGDFLGKVWLSFIKECAEFSEEKFRKGIPFIGKTA